MLLWTGSAGVLTRAVGRRSENHSAYAERTAFPSPEAD